MNQIFLGNAILNNRVMLENIIEIQENVNSDINTDSNDRDVDELTRTINGLSIGRTAEENEIYMLTQCLVMIECSLKILCSVSYTFKISL